MNFRSRFRQSFDFIRRSVNPSVAPLEWMVETTNRCNLACPMCTRTSVKLQPVDMSFDLFEHIVHGHPEVEAIWPYGFGEPLMHPRIVDFITIAKRHSRTVSLSTNATLLNEDNSRKLMESRLDYLILPVDGADDHAYEMNRYPAMLDEVESRIELFLRLKQTLRSRIHVTVQMIRMRNNLDQIGTFRRKWRREGVDVIRVRDDLSGNYHGAPLKVGYTPRRPCFFLWRGPLFVQAAGTVIPCPYYHGTPPVGDLRHQTAREVWASEPMRKLRAAHVEGDLSQYPICKRCPRYQPHPMLGTLSFFVTTWHIRRVFPVIENLQRRIGRKFFE